MKSTKQNFHIDNETLKRVEAFREAFGTPKSAIYRRAIRHYLDYLSSGNIVEKLRGGEKN